jgi:hypothetical protein
VSRFERRRSIATEPVIAGARPTMLEGDEPFEVSCDPAQQDALWKATSARRGTPVVLEVRATLVPEGGDGPATIGVRLEGIRVGTLDPDDAADLSEGLLAVMHRNNTDVAVRSRPDRLRLRSTGSRGDPNRAQRFRRSTMGRDLAA